MLLIILLVCCSSCFSQKNNVLILVDSNVNVVSKHNSIDFFFLGYNDSVTKSALPKSSFWLQTIREKVYNESTNNFIRLSAREASDSVAKRSWDFLRRYNFYVQYSENNIPKIYRVTQKAAFYSEE